MTTWTLLSARQKLRVKADADRFTVLWRDQINNGLFGECVKMLVSCICGQHHNHHVAISDLVARTGWDIPTLARFLCQEGGISERTIKQGCPEDDPDKERLVAELEVLRSVARSCDEQTPWAREDLHPYVLTWHFQIAEGAAPVRPLAD